jgi:hypothetical protein
MGLPKHPPHHGRLTSRRANRDFFLAAATVLPPAREGCRDERRREALCREDESSVMFLAMADDVSMLLRNTWSHRHASENRMRDGLGVGKVRTRGLSVGLSLCTHPRGYSVISHEAVRRLSLVIILALLERLLCTSDQSNSAGPRRRPSQPWIASCPTPSSLSSRLGDGPPVGSTQSRSNRNKWYRHGRR